MQATTTKDIDWATWTPKDIATLLFVFNGDEVLLIRKKRGLGAGKINAPGGKVDPGETFAQAAARELKEEVGVEAWDLKYVGDHRFQFSDGYAMHVHVYQTRHFKGDPIETPEAIPLWVSIEAIPYDEMWADDILWIPLMLEGKCFSGKYIFDDSTMLSHDIRVL